MSIQSHEASTLQSGQRIWLNEQHFISVDGEGYIIGTCYEGALGCVLPVQSATSQLALKLPRLLADTLRENAYIAQVVDSESKVVLRANEALRGTSSDAMDGDRYRDERSGYLIPVETYQSDVLRGIRQLSNVRDEDPARDEKLAQHGGLLLFSFGKDRNPRVCNVKHERGKLIVTPQGCERELKDLSDKQWERLLATRSNSYYLELPPKHPADDPVAALQLRHSTLDNTMSELHWPTFWFGGLPSILYRWANGTLQEAVSQMRIRAWTVADHYSLCRRVLQGLNALHSRRLIHGDIRPANIMHIGSPRIADNYHVGDYGSFNDPVSAIGSSAPVATGHTTAGGLGRHRASVFYAQERRAGIERENADVALILDIKVMDPDRSPEFLVYFSWRSRVADSTMHKPRSELVTRLRERWRQALDVPGTIRPGSVDRLRKGDRLRVREFVFTVIEVIDVSEVGAGDSDNQQDPAIAYRCEQRFAHVLHERLTVWPEMSCIPDCTVIGLPNYVEIRQWSAATDMYSIGALVLYTVFMGGMRINPRQEPQDTEVSGHAETQLAQMLESLSDVPSFPALWRDLDTFCHNLEHASSTKHTGEVLARQLVLDQPEPVDLGKFATQATNTLLRSVPHSWNVLWMFRTSDKNGDRSVNVAHYLLFMHFVMACLHRRSHLVSERHPPPLRDYPFCEDRCVPPGTGGPAELAAARITLLKGWLALPRFDGFVVLEKDLEKHDRRNDPQLRVAHAQLRNDHEEVKRDRDTAVTELESTNRLLAQARTQVTEQAKLLVNLRGEHDTLKREHDTFKRECDEIRQRAEHLGEQARLHVNLQRDHDTLKREVDSLKRENTTLRLQAEQLAEELQGRTRHLEDITASLESSRAQTQHHIDLAQASRRAHETAQNELKHSTAARERLQEQLGRLGQQLGGEQQLATRLRDERDAAQQRLTDRAEQVNRILVDKFSAAMDEMQKAVGALKSAGMMSPKGDYFKYLEQQLKFWSDWGRSSPI